MIGEDWETMKSNESGRHEETRYAEILSVGATCNAIFWPDLLQD